MKHIPWTDEEDRQLAVLRLDPGMSTGEIAAELGRTKDSVDGRIRVLSLAGRGGREKCEAMIAGTLRWSSWRGWVRPVR